MFDNLNTLYYFIHVRKEFAIYDYDDYRIADGMFHNNVLTSYNGIIDLNHDLDSKLKFIHQEIFNECGIFFKTKYNEEPHVFERENRTGFRNNPKVIYCYYTLHNLRTDTVDVYIDIIDKIKFLLKCCDVKIKLNTNNAKFVVGNIYIPIRFYSVDEPTPVEMSRYKQQREYLKSLTEFVF